MANLWALINTKVDEAKDKIGRYTKPLTYTETGSGVTKHRNLDVYVRNMAEDPVNVTGAVTTDVSSLATADLTQSDLNANKLTFGSPMSGLLVSNDGDADFTVTILNKTYTVKTGEIRSFEFKETFTEATFSDNAVFRANGLGGI